MAKIVIIGGSFGGLTSAFELKRLLGGKHEVTLLSEEPRFVFIPSLPWVALGWKDPKKIVMDLRKPLQSKGIQFRHESAQQIDPNGMTVTTSKDMLPYDYLIIATGSAYLFNAIPNLGPDQGHTHSLLTLDHALKAKEALARTLAADSGNIVLGNAQGASCLGPAYEMAMMVDTALRRKKKRSKFNISFVTNEPFLGHFGVGGMGRTRRAMEDEFYDRDISFHLNAEIAGITPKEIELKNGTKIGQDFAMIMPPFRGVDAVMNSQGIGNPKGFVPVDEHYKHKIYPNIYSVGVAMAIPPCNTPVPVGVPKTGDMTVQMARIAARSIASDITGQKSDPLPDIHVLCVADAGDTAMFMYGSPFQAPRNRALVKKGRWAHWAKVAFEHYFMYKIRRGMTYLP